LRQIAKGAEFVVARYIFKIDETVIAAESNCQLPVAIKAERAGIVT